MSEEYWKTLRCRYCNSKGRIYPARSELIGTERGFGYVTRTQIVQTVGQQGNPVQELIFGQGSSYSKQQVVYTQERVPVVRSKIRTVYQCNKCLAFVGDRTFTREVEDLSAPQQQQTVVQREIQREVQREVLRVPCKYCKTLLDPIRERKCPNCSAVVAT